jgi:hypothetical protein
VLGLLVDGDALHLTPAFKSRMLANPYGIEKFGLRAHQQHRDFASLTSAFSGRPVSDPKQLRILGLRYGVIRAQALTPRESLAFIEQVLERRDQQALCRGRFRVGVVQE